MGMGRQSVSVDVVVVMESFCLLRNRTVNVSRTVNASVGHSPGIGYPSSCLIPDKTQEVKIRTSPFNYNHLFGKNT